MRPEDLRAFARRDWHRAEQSKLDYWTRVRDEQGALRVLAAADALRVHVQRFTTENADRERASDLRHHVELKRKIDAASRWFRR
jgi:hypothetical protein